MLEALRRESRAQADHTGFTLVALLQVCGHLAPARAWNLRPTSRPVAGYAALPD